MSAKSRKLKTLLAILFIVGLLLVPSSGDAATCCKWLDCYTCRKQINITSAAGAGTDYPVSVVVHSGFNESIEEQALKFTSYTLYSGAKTRVGQRLTISSRTVASLTFSLYKGEFPNSPSGDITFTIRQLDDTILASKVWGDAGDLGFGEVLREVTFDAPVFINEEVRISCEFSGGDSTHLVGVSYQNTDVKANEGLTYYNGSWTDEDGNGNDYDCTYKYSYHVGDSAGVVYLNDYCTDFPNDIRFTDDDGVTKLDHFCLNLTADPVEFRIEVADNLTNNQSIAIYYGKVGASSASNITNTFPVFSDDFPGSDIDTNKWSEQSVCATVTDGVLHAYPTADYGGLRSFSPIDTSVSRMLEADVRFSVISNQLGIGLCEVTDATTWWAKHYLWARQYHIGIWDRFERWLGYDAAFDVDVSITPTDNNYHHIKQLFKDGTVCTVWQDADSWATTHTLTTDTYYIWLPKAYNTNATDEWMEAKWIFVRKCVIPEPVVGTPGGQEIRERRYGYIMG